MVMKVHVIHANKGENLPHGKKALVTNMKKWDHSDKDIKLRLKTDKWFIFNAKHKLYKTNLNAHDVMILNTEYTIMDNLKAGDTKIIEL